MCRYKIPKNKHFNIFVWKSSVYILYLPNNRKLSLKHRYSYYLYCFSNLLFSFMPSFVFIKYYLYITLLYTINYYETLKDYERNSENIKDNIGIYF